MKGNHLLLSDVGAEYHGYTADVTRTIPVDGKYSKEEKIIYNIVLEAQNKAIAECKAGNPFYITNTIAIRVPPVRSRSGYHRDSIKLFAKKYQPPTPIAAIIAVHGVEVAESHKGGSLVFPNFRARRQPLI